MSILLSINSDAQQEILEGLVNITSDHSEKSKKSLIEKLKNLASRQDMDIVITGYRISKNLHQTEFSLAFFKKTEGGKEYHPQYHPQNVLMIGGLVYHKYTDSWSVNT